MKTSRRDFIKSSGILSAGVLAGLSAAVSCKQADNPLKNLGIIGTISKEVKEDWRKAFGELAEIGYKYLESPGIYGDSTREFKDFIQQIGLKAISRGASMAQFLNEDDFNKMILEAHDLDCEYIVCYWPWMSDALNLTHDELNTAVDNLSDIGKKCKAEGLTFAFHNHDKEFKPLDDIVPYDYILANTDPGLVKAEIDLYWIYKGNDEPIHYFEKYPGRFELVHVKDMDNTEERSFACVGDGIIDFPAIFSRSSLAGMKYLVVEHDRPDNGMECARTSYEYLQRIL